MGSFIQKFRYIVIGLSLFACWDSPAATCHASTSLEPMISLPSDKGVFRAVSKSGAFSAKALFSDDVGYVVMEIFEGSENLGSIGPDAVAEFDLRSAIVKPHLYYASRNGDFATIDCTK